LSEAIYQQTRAYLLSIGNRIETLIQLEKALELKMSWLSHPSMMKVADQIISELEKELNDY